MKRIAIVLMACLTAVAVCAQSDDFGIWTSLELQKKINKKWNVSAEAEMRTRDNVGTVDRWSGGVEADYKLLKGLKVSAGYTFLYDNNERISYFDADDEEVIDEATWDDGTLVKVGDPKKRADYWAPRHRFSVSLTGEKNFGPWGLSLRERWQYTYRPEYTVDERYSYYDDDMDGTSHTYRSKGKSVLRSRLQVDYKQKGQKVIPYVSVEMYNAWSVQKMRYTIGADWKVTKKHVLGLSYRYQTVHNDDFDNEPNRHILGIGYKYKF